MQSQDVRYFVHQKQSKLDWICALDGFSGTEKFGSTVQRSLIDSQRTSCSNTYFSYTRCLLDPRELETIRDADVVNLHWVEKLLSTIAISRLLRGKRPVVWTLHDERPLTGGCHYTADCVQNRLNGCRNCIQLKPKGRSIPRYELELKKLAFADADITLVSPSRWLAEQARASAVFSRHRVEVIPNSVETDLFRPRNKRLAREALDLPADRFIILFGAQDAKERRKGYNELCEAIGFFLSGLTAGRRSPGGQPLVLMFGEDSSAEWSLPLERRFVGTIHDDRRLALVYSAADIFALPSLEDNLPNTVLEAMACGTPSVGFPVGGVPDMVRPGVTGFLAPLVSARAFAHALSQAYADPARLEALSIRCTDAARREYNQPLQAHRYKHLFMELVSERAAGFYLNTDSFRAT